MFEEQPNQYEAPNFQFIRYLPNLYQLDLTGNNITNIEFLENLTSITQLVLTDNSLVTIKGIETLHKLEYLELDRCMLTSLAGVEQLTLLKNFYAHDNKLNLEQILEYRRQLSGIENIGL